MGKAKRAHQFHESGQWRSFEDGRQINFREKDREKKSIPSDPVFFNRSSEVNRQEETIKKTKF